MTRSLKAIGISAMAVMAMTAVMATAAQATPTAAKFTAASYPAYVHAESAKGKEIFTTEAGQVKCKSTFTGTLSESSQTFTITPTYSECEAFGFLSATVNMEKCNYLFHLTTEFAVSAPTESPAYQAHVDLKCGAGESVKIVAGTCEVQVDAQDGMTTVDLYNMKAATPNDVTVTPTVSLKYTVTKDGFGCPFTGLGEKTGTYTSTEKTTARIYEETVDKTRGNAIDGHIG